MSAAIVRTAQVAWDNNSTTSPTLNLDCTGGNFVRVWVCFRNTATTTISSLTVGGNAATRIGSVFVSASPRQDTDAFRYSSPTTGSQAIVVTSSAAIGGAGNDGFIIASLYSGVDVAGTPVGDDQHFEAISPFSALSTTVTGVTANDVVDDVAFVNGSTSSLTPGGSQTATTLVSGGTVADGRSSSMTGSGSVNPTWTYGPSATYNAVQRAIVIKGTSGSTSAKLLSMINNQAGF